MWYLPRRCVEKQQKEAIKISRKVQGKDVPKNHKNRNPLKSSLSKNVLGNNNDYYNSFLEDEIQGIRNRQTFLQPRCHIKLLSLFDSLR